jgi:hypothetical protein
MRRAPTRYRGCVKTQMFLLVFAPTSLSRKWVFSAQPPRPLRLRGKSRPKSIHRRDAEGAENAQSSFFPTAHDTQRSLRLEHLVHYPGSARSRFTRARTLARSDQFIHHGLN